MTTPAGAAAVRSLNLLKARIRDGYVYDPVRTPREHKKLLGDSVVTDDFIHSYCDARYSGGTAAVGDEDVERALPLVSKNGRDLLACRIFRRQYEAYRIKKPQC